MIGETLLGSYDALKTVKSFKQDASKRIVVYLYSTGNTSNVAQISEFRDWCPGTVQHDMMLQQLTSLKKARRGQKKVSKGISTLILAYSHSWSPRSLTLRGQSTKLMIFIPVY